jgi:hypothetical protein
MVYHITHKSASYLYFQNYAECALALVTRDLTNPCRTIRRADSFKQEKA